MQRISVCLDQEHIFILAKLIVWPHAQCLTKNEDCTLFNPFFVFESFRLWIDEIREWDVSCAEDVSTVKGLVRLWSCAVKPALRTAINNLGFGRDVK